MTSTWCVVALVCGGALLAAPLQAAEEPVDPDFLEFLGSVDSNEAGWHDYLAATDVDALVKAQSAANGGSAPPANDTGKVKEP
ncbi:MAG TPA: hypothetical protein VGN77_07075 [Steroidobacteraceae bacterium]|jgi:hypothetical protein|nr:hypothetical protein [Steroidobacteraceae bacterium]